jgi:hypothetical protein
VKDSLSLVRQGQPANLQALLCTEELNDVNNLISNAKVRLPDQYSLVAREAKGLQPILAFAAIARS